MAKRAERKIRQYGTKAVLRIPSGKSAWDDDTSSWIDEYEEHRGVCLVSNYEQRDIDGTVIEAGDRKLLCVFENNRLVPLIPEEIGSEDAGLILAENDEVLLAEAGKRRLAAEPKVKPKVSLIDVYKKTGTWEATYKVITCSPLVPDGTTVILFKIQGRG
jgi:hypothetical protein